VGLCLAQIAAYIFLILPTNVLTYINEDIGPSQSVSWVNIARTLAESTMFLVSGRLSDLFGRRWFFIGGNVICLVGVIIGACAQNINTLIVASAVYGLGECIQLSFGVAIGELVKNKHRPIVVRIARCHNLCNLLIKFRCRSYLQRQLQLLLSGLRLLELSFRTRHWDGAGHTT
jgi:MFS family permease